MQQANHISQTFFMWMNNLAPFMKIYNLLLARIRTAKHSLLFFILAVIALLVDILTNPSMASYFNVKQCLPVSFHYQFSITGAQLKTDSK